MATKATETATRKQPGRWWRRWMVICLVWAVPVVALGVKEMVSEMLYDSADLKVTLDRWVLSDPQHKLPGSTHCTGTLEAARAAGCPAVIVDANLALRNEAIAEVHTRRVTQVAGFFEAAIFYWVMPCVFILAVGIVLALIRRVLRRPPSTPSAGPPGSVGTAERPR
ncbi:hypothetical protein [Pararobbsia alpina]|uniref:Transmembrane protein n=1 Tax=Pararobbsia alpina TaxID=621374 RepID=A0A6S7BHZ7_9BURK|nr:hypothetical protein [Pararobbsia alpina]CAB3799460.1 hypothetical protein LMG28138_04653 [Pararobbsia alpina]